jgi:hypothetical protein
MSEFTPREAAHSIAIGWLYHAYHDRTSDIDDSGPPSHQREVRRQVARLHNFLLRESGMDGQELGEG